MYQFLQGPESVEKLDSGVAACSEMLLPCSESCSDFGGNSMSALHDTAHPFRTELRVIRFLASWDPGLGGALSCSTESPPHAL